MNEWLIDVYKTCTESKTPVKITQLIQENRITLDASIVCTNSVTAGKKIKKQRICGANTTN